MFRAKKSPLYKEISNVSGSYNVVIQTYELEEKIDDETVFILQFIIGNEDEYIFCDSGLIFPQRSSPSFFDQIWLQHKSRTILCATVNTIFTAFECEDFVQFNESMNRFEFKFDEKQNMQRFTKYHSLSRSTYSQQEAEQVIKNRYIAFERPCQVNVCCINSYDVDDEQWDFEVNLRLLPGRYTIFDEEVPTQINVRDYPRIRRFYQQQLKHFVSNAHIFAQYMRYLGTFHQSCTMIDEWHKNGLESNALLCLYSILCTKDSADDIWDDLYEMCLKYDISERAVADFIALSLRHYLSHRVEHRLEFIESDHKESESSDGVLSESDRYILSIILPYFGKTFYKSFSNEPLSSGLFNHFCDELQAGNEDKWCMKIEPVHLKRKLLSHLTKKLSRDVVNQRYHVTLVEGSGSTTFYMRPQTDCIDASLSFLSIFDVGQGSKPRFDSIIYETVDVFESFGYVWAKWTRRKLNQFKESLGYWKTLNAADDKPLVAVEHLDAILTLLQHHRIKKKELLRKINAHEVSVVFLPENNDLVKVDAKYRITCWNGKKCGNVSLALRLMKSALGNQSVAGDPEYFKHYRSDNADN